MVMDCRKELCRLFGLWRWLSVVTSVGIIAVSAAASDLSQTDFEEALSAIGNYERSQSRAPMFLIESYIRQNQDRPEMLQSVEGTLAGMLKQNITYECKLFICRQLWKIGTDRSVPALAELLTDESTIDSAVYALNSNPSPAAGNALRDALKSVHGAPSVAIINVLGERRDTKAVEALEKRLNDSDSSVAFAALAALGKIGTDKCSRPLAKARQSSNRELAEAASHAYLQCADELLAKEEFKKAGAIYRELLESSESIAIRRGALCGWVTVGSDDGLSELVSVLKGKDTDLESAAIGCVRTLSDRKAIRQIAKASESFDAGIRGIVLEALADCNDSEVRDAAVEAAKSNDIGVRVSAIRALSKVGDRKCIAILVPFLAGQQSNEEREAARLSLESLQGDDVDREIWDWFKNVDSTAKVSLIEIIAVRGFHDAVPDLLAEVQSDDLDVHHAAIDALGILGREKDLVDLLQLLNAPRCKDDWERIEKAIVLTANKTESPTARTHPIFAALLRTDNPKLKCSLLRILSGLGTELARKVIRDSLRDQNIQVRYSAFQSYMVALSEAPDKTDADRIKEYRLALHWARSPDEIKIVLTAAGVIGRQDALDLVVPYLDQFPVRDCAARSAINISTHLTETDSRHVKEVLKKILAFTNDSETQTKAQAVIREIEKFENYITNWQASGPYRQEGKTCTELFDLVFLPEESSSLGVQWRSVPQGTNPDQPWLVNLGQLFSEEEGQVAYLYTWIESPIEGEARLEMGSDDGIKVWLNGQLVHTNNVTRGVVPGEDTAEVQLQLGWNALLVKVTQNTSEWGLCLRVRDREGNQIEGIIVDSLHPGIPKPLAN